MKDRKQATLAIPNHTLKIVLVSAIFSAAALSMMSGRVQASQSHKQLKQNLFASFAGAYPLLCRSPRAAGSDIGAEIDSWLNASDANHGPYTAAPAPLDFAAHDFQVLQVSDHSAVVVWRTNAPATSQVRVMDPQSGRESWTPVDPQPSLLHRVEIKGLPPASLAGLQAFSRHVDGQTIATTGVNTIRTAAAN